MQPDFTDEEQYLISYWKSGHAEGTWSQVSREATYLVAPLIMVGLGYYFDSYLLAMSGLFVYALFKIREVILQAKYKPIVASIIRKYEAKLAELDSQAHSSQTTSASNAS